MVQPVPKTGGPRTASTSMKKNLGSPNQAGYRGWIGDVEVQGRLRSPLRAVLTVETVCNISKRYTANILLGLVNFQSALQIAKQKDDELLDRYPPGKDS